MLQRAVVAIQTKQPIDTSREELYRAVEDLCVHKMGANLYDRQAQQSNVQLLCSMPTIHAILSRQRKCPPLDVLRLDLVT